MDLSLVNRHWNEGFRYEFPLARQMYRDLCVALEKKFIISLVGLRRTGKTTLLKQLINHLIERNVPRANILYYTFDEPAELSDVLGEYLRLSSQELTSTLYVLLDEVQKLPDWQNKVKIYYDHYPNIKFIVSGSSSLFIRKKSESLAGRMQEFVLLPLSFREFLLFRRKEELLQKKNLFAAVLMQECERYASRQFIEILDVGEDERKEYMDSLARKVIYEDIPQVFPVEQPQVLWKLFKVICSSPGMLIDYHGLSSDLSMNEKTLSNYVEFLEKAFLIQKVYNYSTNLLTSEKKLKKAYPVASSFCEGELSKRMESLAVVQLKCLFFWRRTHEVDCILVKKDRIIPVEIKYKSAVQDKELRGLKAFLQKFDTLHGVVLTKDMEKDGSIRFVPLWKFLIDL